MSTGSLKGSAHSAHVRMELHVNGYVLPLAQLGPNFLILKDSVDHPPADAEIRLSIDDQESRWPVRLVEGLASNQTRARISGCA
jgi:hypothetical protein